MTKLRVGSTFSGVGGLDLGLERAGHEVLFQAEAEPYRRRVLARHWPGVPCFPDVREVGAEGLQRVGLRGLVRAGGGDDAGSEGLEGPSDAPDGGLDLLCGGFPCQDLSVAGKRRGLAGERSSLFFEFARIADELVRPGGWILVENVPGLLSGCSCVGCEKCGELLRLHSRGWRHVGRDAGRDSGELRLDLGVADDGSVDGGNGSSRGGSGRCPCRRCDEARRLIAAHNGTEFSVVRSVLGNLGFHDLAWRVLDSRYLGVPQRRRRVFILARRARGRRAAEVLLEPESGGGDFEAGQSAKPRASLLAEGGAVQALDRRGGGADDNEAQAGHLIAPDVASPLTRGSSRPGISDPGRRQEDDWNVVAHTLRAEGFDASEDGTGRGPRDAVHPPADDGRGKAGAGVPGGPAGGSGEEADADGVREAPGVPGGVDVGAVSIHPDAMGRSGDAENPSVDAAGAVRRRDPGLGVSTDGAAHTLSTGAPPGVFNLRGREEGARVEIDDVASLRASAGGSSRSYLYGDGGPAGDRCAFDPTPDGPRYAACGDAVTVNVAEWIGRRLAEMA